MYHHHHIVMLLESSAHCYARIQIHSALIELIQYILLALIEHFVMIEFQIAIFDFLSVFVFCNFQIICNENHNGKHNLTCNGSILSINRVNADCQEEQHCSNIRWNCVVKALSVIQRRLLPKLVQKEELRMSQRKDLLQILETLSPEMRDEDYVFCTFENAKYGNYVPLNPIASFQEKEGLTLVIESEIATKYKIKKSSIMKCITLNVHSDLELIGLTAEVSRILSKNDIPANVIAGFYHDHIFVPKDKAQKALKALKTLQFTQSKL